MRVVWLLVIFNKTHQSREVGHLQVEKFEEKIQSMGEKVIRVADSMYAVSFY